MDLQADGPLPGRGESAFEPGSRRPRSSPTATDPLTVELITTLRKRLVEQGLDAGADTIRWHLAQHHKITISRASIHRILTRNGQVTPDPAKRPKSSYIRFQADQPNECWQSDFTHYPLHRPGDTPGRPTGPDTEIVSWLDDHSRYALHVSAHPRITGPIVADTFIETTSRHGNPASVLTDNGLVYTTRFARGHGYKHPGTHSGRDGQRNGLEQLLRTRNIIQKNSRPSHPTTCGKIERFQQTLKKWLRAQPDQPTTIDQLQTLINRFVDLYNHHRPHRSLPHQATPATAYTARPKANPTSHGTDRSTDSHDRVREDIIDKSGSVTLRVAGKLRHIGIGRTHARTRVLLLVHDLHVEVINATTGELLRELDINPNRDYQPLGTRPGRPQKTKNPNPQTEGSGYADVLRHHNCDPSGI
ncbi:IS481 family transposase [Microlunatus endophyticus]